MKKFYTLLVTIVLTINLSGNTLIVTSTANSGAGTLREAVSLAQSGDTIAFATLAGGIVTLSGQLAINQNVVIQGTPGANLITIQQTIASGARVFVVSTGMTVEINLLNIIDGYGLGAGSGILNNGDLTLNNCRFSNNVVVVQTVTGIIGGGAIFNNTSGILTINNCEFYDNNTDAIFNGVAKLGGGAIFNRGSRVEINNSSFYNNSATQVNNSSSTEIKGGAIYNGSGHIIINSCTFSGNFINAPSFTSPFPSCYGGAIHNLDSMTITNSTINENTITGVIVQGGNIWNDGKLLLYNTIIANGVIPATGSGVDIYTTFGGNGSTISLGNNLLESPLGSNMVLNGDVVADPMLAALAYEGISFTKTHALTCSSPAVNAGNSTNAPAADQNGKLRIVGNSIDIGSVELQSTLTGSIITNVGNQLSVPGNGTYQWYFNNVLISGATNFTYTTTQSGNYYVIVTDSVGCGPFSSDTVNVLFCVPNTGTDVQTACNSFVWIDGNTYTANNNTATFNIINGNATGCDSLVTLNLTINTSSTGTDVQIACNSFVWIDGNTYTTNNNSTTFNIVNGNATGCDSLVTLNLTINTSSTGTDVQIACNSFVWIDGNTYTTNNNSTTFNIVNGNATGCDSLVTLNLTINTSSTGTDVQIACNSFLWIDGNTYTTSTNTSTFNIINGNATGCDSLVTLNLTINTVDVSTTAAADSITANASGATYQWLDCNNNYATINGATAQTYTAPSNGDYAVQVTQNGCIDTSVCVNILITEVIEKSLFNNVSIYPNPTKGVVNIYLGSLKKATINVFNLNGQLISHNENINTPTFQFELKEAPGFYFIEVISQEEKQQYKLIKK